MQHDDRAGRERAGYPLATVTARSCILCSACRHTCPNKAITIRGGRIRVDAELCDGCGACVERCTPSAIRLKERPTDPAVQSPHDQG